MRLRACILLSTALTLTLVGCGGGGDTTGPPKDPALGFVPPVGQAQEVGLLETRTFSVSVEPAAPIDVRFFLDDELVALDAAWGFEALKIGEFVVSAQVVLEGDSTRVEWPVRVTGQNLSPLPPVQSLQATDGDIPGSIALQWDRSDGIEAQLSVVSYDVAYSQTAFPAEAFDAQNIVTFAHRPGFILQPNQLEGLEESRLYHLRVRATDSAGRHSATNPLSGNPARMFEATGHFELSGFVRALREGVPGIAPVATVLVEASSELGSVPALTDADGGFRLDTMVDVGEWTLRVEAGGSSFYPIEVRYIDPSQLVGGMRDFEFLLVPRGVIDIVGAVEPWSEQVSQMEFLRRMTGNDPGGVTPDDFVTWENYPVTLYVHEYNYESEVELVSYGQAFRAARDRWNAAAGEEILRVVSIPAPIDPATQPDLRGAIYDPSLETSGGSLQLGEVSLVYPVGGNLFEDVPRLMVVALRNSFRTQEIADFIVAHEVGHVLGLRHSGTSEHLMAPAPNLAQGGAPTAEEALVARFLKYVNPENATYYYRDVD